MKIKRNNENIFPGAKKGLINSYLSLKEFMLNRGRRDNKTIKLLESSTGSGALRGGQGQEWSEAQSMATLCSGWIDLFPVVER